MISQILLIVEHDETTDGLSALVESFKPSRFHDPYRVTVIDYSVTVDTANVPEWQHLDDTFCDSAVIFDNVPDLFICDKHDRRVYKKEN